MMAARNWSFVLDAARQGDLPLVHIGQTPAMVARSFGGVQPVYLATPYTKECTDVLGAWSYDLSRAMGRRAETAMADLQACGVSAIAPVAARVGIIHAGGAFMGAARGGVQFKPHCDPLAAFWSHWRMPFLNVCGAVVVPAIPGWDHSEGIWADVQHAFARNIPVFIYGGKS